ncbi:MAG: SMP-30/gluconolactonase/LRE family protein [Sphingomonas sp.]
MESAMDMTGPGWRCLWEAGATLGESPIYDARDGRLYWVDVENPSINWIDIDSEAKGRWIPPMWISAIGLRARGGFIASTRDGLAYVDPATEMFELFADPRPDARTTRLNDGVVDHKGRYWTGSCDCTQFADSTQSENKEDSVRDFDKRSTGELYRVDPDGRITTMERDVVTANGPAFSPDGRTMYFNDSLPRVTWAYDLAEDGSIANRRDWLRYGDGDGFPDGMAVDVEGGIWIAFYESWTLRRYSPDARLLDERRLPVRQGLRPAFGGANLDRLFLTSAANALSARARAEQPLAGSVFEILDPGVRGLPNAAFAG